MNVNYKTMLLCAVIGVSMQTAHGMEDDRADLPMIADSVFAEVNQAIRIAELAADEYVRSMKDFEGGDPSDMTEFSKECRALFFKKVAMHQATQVVDEVHAYDVLRKACLQEGIFENTQEYKETELKMVALDAERSKVELQQWGRSVGNFKSELADVYADYSLRRKGLTSVNDAKIRLHCFNEFGKCIDLEELENLSAFKEVVPKAVAVLQRSSIIDEKSHDEIVIQCAIQAGAVMEEYCKVLAVYNANQNNNNNK